MLLLRYFDNNAQIRVTYKGSFYKDYLYLIICFQILKATKYLIYTVIIPNCSSYWTNGKGRQLNEGFERSHEDN